MKLKLTTQQEKTARSLVNKAYAEAIKKYPWWPANIFEGLCILNEEQGELAKALYDHVHAGQPLDRAIEEAAQTAAMSLRMLQQLLYLHPTGYRVAPKKRGPYKKRKKLVDNNYVDNALEVY